MSAPWDKTFKRRRRKKAGLLSRAGKHKSPPRGCERNAPFGGYRKVKIINVDSNEALRADKGGKTLHFGSADPRSVINPFKEAEIKGKQRGPAEGERRFQSGRQALAPARQPPRPLRASPGSPNCTASVPLRLFPSFQTIWTFTRGTTECNVNHTCMVPHRKGSAENTKSITRWVTIARIKQNVF